MLISLILSSFNFTAAVPIINVQHENLDFGMVEWGVEHEIPLTIRNDGDEDLLIENVNVNARTFSTNWVLIHPEFYWEFENTDNNMSVLVRFDELGDDPPIESGYIGAFNEEGICFDERQL